MTDAERILLGLAPMRAMIERFYDAVMASESGISVREMAKKNPDAPLIDWMQAGQLMERKYGAKVKHTWSQVKNNVAAAQESRYSKSQP